MGDTVAVTAHLDEDGVRRLALHCLASGAVRRSDIATRGSCDVANLGKWLNNKRGSPASLRACRTTLDALYSERRGDVPPEFAPDDARSASSSVSSGTLSKNSVPSASSSLSSSSSSSCERDKVGCKRAAQRGIDAAASAAASLLCGAADSDGEQSSTDVFHSPRASLPADDDDCAPASCESDESSARDSLPYRSLSLSSSSSSSSSSREDELPVVGDAELPRATSGEHVDVKLCTWNLKNIGKSTPIERKLRAAMIIASHTVVAVQEVRCEALMEQLRSAGAGALLKNHRIVQNVPNGGGGARRECMALVYDSSVLDVVHTRTFDAHYGSQLDDCVAGMRYKPLVVTFCARGAVRRAAALSKFSVLCAHVRYGADESVAAGGAAVAAASNEHTSKSCTRAAARAQRASEVAGLARAHAWLAAHGDSFGREVYVCGDFNLEPKHEAFTPFRHAALRPCVESGVKTTIGANRWSYDNIWAPSTSLQVQFHSARVATLCDLVALEDAQSRALFRKQFSDHLPVFVHLRLPRRAHTATRQRRANKRETSPSP